MEGGLDAQAVVAVPGEEQGVGLVGSNVAHIEHALEQALALGCGVTIKAQSLRGGTQRLLLGKQHAAVEGHIGERNAPPRHLDDTSARHLVEALGGIGRAVQVHLLGARGGEGVAVELPHHVGARGTPHDPLVAQLEEFRAFPEAGEVALRRPVGEVCGGVDGVSVALVEHQHPVSVVTAVAEELRVACVVAPPAQVRVDDGIAGMLGEGASAIGADSHTLALGLRAVSGVEDNHLRAVHPG